MERVFLVSSGKGGTGKTMFSVNMGAVLSQQGHRVIMIDMDIGLRNMDLYLGMESKVVYNVMDVLSGICRIKKAMIKVDGFDSLYFMAASPVRDERDITPLHVEVLCKKLSMLFDYIIMDCPAGIGDYLDSCITVAEKAIIITEPDVASLRDADTVEKYFNSNGISDTEIVINKVKGDLMRAGLIPGINTIYDMFNGSVVGIIQDDDNIHISTNKGIPIVGKKGTYIERNFRDMVKRIIE